MEWMASLVTWAGRPVGKLQKLLRTWSCKGVLYGAGVGRALLPGLDMVVSDGLYDGSDEIWGFPRGRLSFN